MVLRASTGALGAVGADTLAKYYSGRKREISPATTGIMSITSAAKARSWRGSGRSGMYVTLLLTVDCNCGLSLVTMNSEEIRLCHSRLTSN
jgi:phosphoribosyl-AMP cyclohydrolase